MASEKRVSFGVKTAPQNTTYEDMLRVWREADAQPEFAHAWLFDHFTPLGNDPTGPCLEGWTLLAAFAAETKRLRVGIMVTGNTYRHPAVLANMGATVDIISQGRMDFGIGAGWNELEHSMYDIPLYGVGERIARLGEACEMIRRLWTETTVDYEGKYYTLRGARCEPKPVQKPYPPFVIGGQGERKTLRVVAQYADIWNMPGATPEEFRHKSAVLDEHCAAVGRDPAAIQRSVQLRTTYGDLPDVRQKSREMIEAGANHIVYTLSYPYPEGIVARVASEVVVPLREEMGLAV